MKGAHELLFAITVVLCVAAVTTVVFQRLRQPVVLGYLLAGLIVGPHVPVPLVADRATIQTLSELGVILLMFALGLEFSPRKLIQVGPRAGTTALVQSSIMVWLGFLAGRAFGWTVLESVFAGAIVAMSSTTIIAKAFDELKVRGPLRDLVVGVLLVEDLFAVLFMAVLTAVATGAGVSPGDLAATMGKLAGFLALLLAGGMLVVPRAVRYIRRRGNTETLLVAALGICLLYSTLAVAAGYSVALGAFLGGSLVAESGEAHAVEEVIRPVRDLFAAIFFVSVGMLIDPALVAQHWAAVLVFLGLVVVGKSAAVGLGALLTGHGVRTSTQAGMSLAQIGEFSFILAALGSSLGATRDFLYPIAVAVSAATTLLTPRLVEGSGAAAAWLDGRLPGPLQTVVSLYGSWVEQLGRSPGRSTLATRLRKVAAALVLDAVLVAALAVGAGLGAPTAAPRIGALLHLDPAAARWLLFGLAGLLCLPFLVALVRNARRLALALARAALPEVAAGRPDLAAAPRRALLAAVQLGAALLVLVPVVALTQPFLPGVPGAVVLLVVVAVLGVGFWRSAADLQGHVRAGAQVIVEALARQGTPGGQASSGDGDAHDTLAAVRAMFPGMGEPSAVRIDAGSPAAGRSLSALGVRGRTGATVLAVARPGESVMMPSGHEVLRPGDLLAVCGAREAVEAARALLSGSAGPSDVDDPGAGRRGAPPREAAVDPGA